MPFLRLKPHAMQQWKVLCRVVVSPLGASHLLMAEIRRSPVGMVNIPLYYRVLYIPGGSGFQLSTVVPRKLRVIEHVPLTFESTVVAPICNPFAQKDLLHKYAMGIRTDVRVFVRETRFSKDFNGNTLKLNASRVEPQTVNWRNCANTDLTVTLQHLQSWMGDRNVTYRLGQCQWCCWRMVHHGRYTIK